MRIGDDQCLLFTLGSSNHRIKQIAGLRHQRIDTSLQTKLEQRVVNIVA